MKTLFPILLRIYIFFHEDILIVFSIVIIFKAAAIFFKINWSTLNITLNNKTLPVNSDQGGEIDICDKQNTHVKVYVYLNRLIYL